MTSSAYDKDEIRLPGVLVPYWPGQNLIPKEGAVGMNLSYDAQCLFVLGDSSCMLLDFGAV